MAGSDKTVKVSLVADTSRYERGMRSASDATGKLGSKAEAVESKTSKLSGALKGAAVGAGALAGTALVAFLKDAVGAAGDLEQSIGGVDAVFGEAAQKVHDFGKTSAEAVGLSTNSFNELVTLTGALLKNKGLDDFADKSLDLVKIGADLSATYGGTAKEAVEALNAAMRGEGNPIERYGITINQTAIQAELAAKGLNKLTGSALEQAKAQASIDIITRQSADAMGKFASEADTLQGQQQRLSAEWENAKAQLGQFLLPVMTKVTEAIRGGVDAVVAGVHAWEQIPGPIKTAVTALIAFRVAQGTLAKGGTATLSTLKSLREAFAYAAASASRAGGGFAGLGAGMRTFTGQASLAKGAMGGMKAAGSALMGLAGGPWGLAITALTVAITGYFMAQENARKAAEEFAETLDKTTGKFTDQSRELAQNKFFKDFAQEDYSKVAGSLEKAGAGVGNLIAAYEKGGPAVDDFKAKFDEWRRSSEAMDLARQGVNIEALGNSYAALGRDVDRARLIAEVNADAQKNTADATKDAGDAAAQATPPVDNYAKTLKKIKDEAQKAKDRHKELASAMLEVKAAAGDADAAAIAYQEALDDSTASLKENGRTLDITKEKGRANMTALLNQKDSALALAEANLKNGASVGEVKTQMDGARQAFIDQAVKMGKSKKAAEEMATKYGLTRDSVDDLKGSMDKIPKKVVSDLQVKDEEAKRRVRELQTLLTGDWLNDKTVRITTIYEERGSTAARLAAQTRDTRRLGAVERADGGPVWGAGTATSDSIPAWLSDGEFVVRTAAAQAIGYDRLHYANKHGRLPAFADGGRVGFATGGLASLTGADRAAIYALIQAISNPIRDLSVAAKALASATTPAKRDATALTAAQRTYDKDADWLKRLKGYQQSIKDEKKDLTNRISVLSKAAAATKGVTKADRDLTKARERMDFLNRELTRQDKRVRDQQDKTTKSKDALSKAQTRAKDSADKLKAAQEALAAQQKAVADAAERTSDAMQSMFRGPMADPRQWAANMSQGMGEIGSFNAQIDSLRKAGLSETLVQQIIEQGVRAGSAIAGSILSDKGAIGGLNKASDSLQKAADKLGGNAATGIGRYAAGGAVGGLGGVDKNLAWLTRGEHVLDTSDVDAMGGHAAVYAFRKALHSDYSRLRSAPLGSSAAIDYDRLAQAIDRRGGGQPVTFQAYGMDADAAVQRAMRQWQHQMAVQP